MWVLQINLQKHMHVNVSFGNIRFMEAKLRSIGSITKPKSQFAGHQK